MPLTVEEFKKQIDCLQGRMQSFALADNAKPQDQAIAEYTQTVLKTLADILKNHSSDKESLINALTGFLQNNWTVVQGQPFNYFAIPYHSVTRLIATAAELVVQLKYPLASHMQGLLQAISLLLPTVNLDLLKDEKKPLALTNRVSNPDLSSLLQRNILSKDGNSLIPRDFELGNLLRYGYENSNEKRVAELKQILPDIVTSYDNLRRIILNLGHDPEVDVLKALGDKLASLIPQGWSITDILYTLGTERHRGIITYPLGTVQHKGICQVLASVVQIRPEMIQSEDDLYHLFSALNEKECAQVCHHLQDKIQGFRPTLKEISKFLIGFNNNQIEMLCKIWSVRIQNCEDLASILKYFYHDDQYDAAIKALKHKFELFLPKNIHLETLPKPLQEKNLLASICRVLCNDEAWVLQLIQTPTDLQTAIQICSPKQCLSICLSLNDKLPQLLPTAKDIATVLSKLHPSQCESVCDILKEKIQKIDTVEDIWQLLHPFVNGHVRPVSIRLVELLYKNLPNSLKSAKDFEQILEVFDEKRMPLYVKYQSQLITLIQSGDDSELAKNFGHVLKYLNKEQRQLIFNEFIGKFSSMIKTAKDFQHVMPYLDDDQYDIVYKELKGSFAERITVASDLNRVGKYFACAIAEELRDKSFQLILSSKDFHELSSSTNAVVRSELQNQSPELAPSAWRLSYCLHARPANECKAILEKMPDKLEQLIPTASELQELLSLFSDEQSKVVIDLIRDKIPALIPSTKEFSNAVQGLSGSMTKLIIASIPKEQLLRIFPTCKDLDLQLEEMGHRQQQVLTNAIFEVLTEQKLVSQYIQTRPDFLCIFQTLDNAGRKTLLKECPDLANTPSVIKGILDIVNFNYENDVELKDMVGEIVRHSIKNLIKTQNDLIYFRKYVNLFWPDPEAFLNSLKDLLPKLIPTFKDFMQLLQYYDRKEYAFVLETLKDKQPPLIPQGWSLGYLLQSLSDRERWHLCDALCQVSLDKLPQLIQSPSDLHALLSYHHSAPYIEIFKVLKDKLPELIPSIDSLLKALFCLNGESCDYLLTLLKPELPGLIPANWQMANLLKAIKPIAPDKRKIVCESFCKTMAGNLAGLFTHASEISECLKYLSPELAKQVNQELAGHPALKPDIPRIERTKITIKGSTHCFKDWFVTKNSELKRKAVNLQLMQFEQALEGNDDQKLATEFRRLVKCVNEHRSKYFKKDELPRSSKQLIDNLSKMTNSDCIKRLNKVLPLGLQENELGQAKHIKLALEGYTKELAKNAVLSLRK